MSCISILLLMPTPLFLFIHTELNTLSRYMSGRVLVFVTGQIYASLMRSWKLLFIQRYLIRRLCRLSRTSYPSSHVYGRQRPKAYVTLCTVISRGERDHIPAESLDLNPINMWHDLKVYIRREVKPRTKEKLIDRIEAFWSTVHIYKCTCRKYIRHLRSVIPRYKMLQQAISNYLVDTVHAYMFYIFKVIDSIVQCDYA